MRERTESVYWSAECLQITVIKKQMQACKAIKAVTYHQGFESTGEFSTHSIG